MTKLAREMQSSDLLVRSMLQDLVRHGYLSTLSSGCDEQGCYGCSIASYCVKPGESGDRPAVYALTSKGEGAIAHPSGD